MIFFIPGYLFIVFILVALSGGYIFLNSFFETIPTVMFWGTIILCSIFWIGEIYFNYRREKQKGRVLCFTLDILGILSCIFIFRSFTSIKYLLIPLFCIIYFACSFLRVKSNVIGNFCIIVLLIFSFLYTTGYTFSSCKIYDKNVIYIKYENLKEKKKKKSLWQGIDPWEISANRNPDEIKGDWDFVYDKIYAPDDIVSKSKNTLGTYYKGDIYFVNENFYNPEHPGWYQVTVNDKTGYVHSRGFVKYYNSQITNETKKRQQKVIGNGIYKYIPSFIINLSQKVYENLNLFYSYKFTSK